VTKLPSQSEALSMIECTGTGKAGKSAKIIASAALAGELSALMKQANWRARTRRWDAEG